MLNRNSDRRSRNACRFLATTGPRQPWFTPRVETLEDRMALAVFIVNNTGDSGRGSIRQAILDANSSADPPTIVFNIPATDANFVDADALLPGGDAAADVFVINPTTPLPALTRDATLIDGTSQAAFTGDTNPFGPEIVLNGPDAIDADGLILQSQANHVSGLTIQGFFGPAIRVLGNSNVITGSYLGTDATGTLVDRNYVGIHVFDAADVVIGGTLPGEGNLISANGTNIWLEGPSTRGGMIQGNRIGTNRTGSSSLTNGALTGTNDNGIYLSGGPHHITIGGSTPEAGNLISGHWQGGISAGAGLGHHVIEGNRIGTNATGTDAIGNGGGIAIAAPDSRIVNNLVSGNGRGIGFYGSDAANQIVVGNLIGTDTTGSFAVPNTYQGIFIEGAPGIRIGGTTIEAQNIISGNGVGVFINNSTELGTSIVGNYIGTDITGTKSVANQVGIQISEASGVTVGGTASGERNLISGNGQGVFIDWISATNNRVQGNWIGTDVTGSQQLGNDSGVVLGHGAHSNFIGTDGDGVNDAREGNLISGNFYDGVFVWAGSERNVVAGNLIGTDATGNSAVPNRHGVNIHLAWNNRIGTNADGVSDDLERNIISGNNGAGVLVHSESNRTEGAYGNVIAGNYIGTSVGGTNALGNALHGVYLTDGASNNTIGDSQAGAGNVIAFNATGVAIQGATAFRNALRGNSIHSNAGLGIDLESDGATANDSGDGDNGANNLQNFPVLTGVQAGTTTHVAGALNSMADTTFTLDFYASTVADSSGFGEGQRWLGSITVVTNAAGDATFDAVLAAATASGEVVTATATDSLGNTSEFSQAVQSILGVKGVTIDIQPESLNLESNGMLTVFVYGAAEFDVSQINVSSVRFAGASAWNSTQVDVNQDGLLDLQLKFRRQDATVLDQIYADLLIADHADCTLDSRRQFAQISLSGELVDQALFSGSDTLSLFLAGRSLRNFLGSLFG